MNRTKRYFALLFIIVLLAEIFIYSFRITFGIQLLAFAILVLSGATRFSLTFLRIIIPLVLIFIIAFIGTMLYGGYSGSNILKDSSHLVRPIIAIAVGYMFARVFADYVLFVRVVVAAGLICAVIHLIRMLVFADFGSMNINVIRTDTGRDSFLELFSLWFLIADPTKIRQKIFTSMIIYRAVVLVIAISCLLYISRAMLVAFGLLAIGYYGYSKITKNTLKFIGIFVVLIGLFYIYLFSIKPARNGTGLEPFLYKIKNAPAEILQTRIDREDHAELWDHWRGYEVKQALFLMEDKPASFLVGTGMGSVVNLKFKAQLTNDKIGIRYISVLHNGYIFVFYKTGALGLCLLLIFLTSLYLFIYRKPSNEIHRAILVSISSIGAYYYFSTLIITGVYIPKDSVIFILGGLLFYESLLKKHVSLRQLPDIRN